MSTGSNTVSPPLSPCMAVGNAPKYGTLVPNRVFVGGISPQTTEEELEALFSNYGTVVDTKIIVDRAGVSKGYGFITFETDEEAKRLQADSDDIFFKDRKLNIAPAVKKQPFSRMYEQSIVTAGSLLCHNGVPYTFHNGMAVFPSLPASHTAHALAAAAYDYSAAAGVAGGQYPQHVAMYHPQPLLTLPQQAPTAATPAMTAYNTQATAAYPSSPAAAVDCRFSQQQQQSGAVQHGWHSGGGAGVTAAAAMTASPGGAAWRWPIQYNTAPQIGAVAPTPYIYLPHTGATVPFFSAVTGQPLSQTASAASSSDYYQLTQPVLYHPGPGHHPHQNTYFTPTGYDTVPFAIDRDYQTDTGDDESRLSAGSVGSSLAPASSLLHGDRHSPGSFHSPSLPVGRLHTHTHSHSKPIHARNNSVHRSSSLYRWLLPAPIPAHSLNLAANPSPVSCVSPLSSVSSHRCVPLVWPQQQQPAMMVGPPAPLITGHRAPRGGGGAYQSTRVLLKSGPPPAPAPAVTPVQQGLGSGVDSTCTDVLPSSGVTMTPPPTPNRQQQQQQQTPNAGSTSAVAATSSRQHSNHSGVHTVNYQQQQQQKQQQQQVDKTSSRFQAMAI